MKTTNQKVDESSNLKFCTLEYRAQSESNDPAVTGTVILLVISTQDSNLCFFVEPNLQEIVLREDLPYIENLINDLPERAALHGAELFRQLSSLAVGPLTTREVGERLNSHPVIEELRSQFVALRAGSL